MEFRNELCLSLSKLLLKRKLPLQSASTKITTQDFKEKRVEKISYCDSNENNLTLIHKLLQV